MILPRPRAAALVALLAGAGPVQALDPARALTQYARASWAEDRGLPQNSVETILQDRRGYLWLGTQDGLARFDGVRFVTFDAASSPELPSGEILALAEDREGRLWIGTAGGLAVREGETLRAIPGPQKARRDVGRLAVAADGTLWCGGQGGLLRVRGGRLEPDPRVTGSVSELLAAPDGALWIGVETRLVRRADGRDVEYSLPAGGRARSFAPARAGGLWIGTDKGVVRFAEGAFLPPAPGLRIDDDVWALHEDRQGNLWIATNAAGLLRLANGSLSRLTAQDQFPELVRALLEDREGNLWVGSLSAGLIRLTDGEVLPYGEPEGLPHDSALGILAAPDGTLWVGTAGGGAHGLRQDGRRLNLSTRDGLPSDVVTTFHAARDGSLWIGTSAGLARSRAGRLTTFTARDGLPGDFVMGIQEDQAGTLWVATQRGLAALRNGRLTAYGQEHGLSGTGLRGVYEDRSGRLWALTVTSVDILEGGRFVASPLAQAVGAISFLEDSRGTIWVGSPDRLYRLDAGRVTSLGSSQGLAPGGVSRLAEDASGGLWLSGAKGVFRYRRAELDELAAGRLARVTPRRFGRESGMRSAECTGGFQGAGDKDSDGRLWFPTSRGVVAIDPSRVREPPPAPSVLIESLSADGRPVDLARDVSLFPGPGQLRIEYTAFAYAVPEALSFRYRLDGVDGGWVEAGARRTAYYTNLRHGSYTFRVGAAGADGRWSGAETRFPFRVAPRFHESRAFLAVAALVGLGLVAGAHRMRTRHLHAREERLEALVHERTHDLEQALVQSREAMRQTETLRAATEALSHSLDLQQVLQRILSELRKVVDSDSASVQELEGRRLRIIAGLGFPNPEEILGVDFDIDAEDSPNGQVVRTRVPRILADTDAYPEFRSGVHGPARIRSWLGVPLVSGDRLIGLVTLDKREPGFYTEDHARLALAFAAQAAVSIENARLFQQARRQADELERRASEIQQAEERNRAVLETAHDAFIGMDRNGVITGWNAQAEAIFGWPRSEALGRRVAEAIIPPQVREAHVRGLERFLATGEGPALGKRLELTALHRDGHTFPVELTISAVRSGGDPVFSAFLRDITERRRAELRLKAQHAATRVLAESATLAEGTPKILEAICESLGWVFGALWYVDPQAERLRCVETWHRPTAELPEFEAITRRTAFPVGTGLPGRIWASGEPAWIPDVALDANFPRAPVAAKEELHGAFGFPVLSRGTVIGVLEFFSPEIQKPDPDLLAMLASVGSQLGQYVERKRTEEALRDSEARYRQLVENASDLIYRTDANGFFTYVNPVSLRVAGYSEDEVAGAHFLDLIHPDYRTQAESFYMEQWLQKVQSTYYEFPMITRDGREVWIGQNVEIVVQDGKIMGFQAVARDITELKRAERAVEEERRQLREIVTCAPVPMAILDREARYVAHSDGWLTHWQLEDESLIGRAHLEVLPWIGERHRQALSQALGGQVLAEPEDLFELPDGSTAYIAWTMHPLLGPSAEVDGVVIVVQSVDVLVKARQAAEQASRAKSTFVASMSHELRTPLNAILGFVQLLGRRPGRDAVDRGHLAVISRSGEHLLGLINDVLSIAKIESGQMSLSPGDFDVAALLLALRELLEPRAAAKGLELRVEVPAAAPRLVTGDEGKVRQILLNLMGNAVKFTDRGRVVLRCGWREGRASFEVEDTGPGLTREEVEGLFAAFAQTETGRRRGDGTGLGLALSRGYARLMDGDISVSSTPGRGSLFRVDVALPRSASQEVVSPAPHRVVRGLAPGQSRSILVADDNEDARLLLGELLRSVGFEVRTAGDGQEALDAWRAAAPHLVFMDIDMPILDGIAAARAIRAEESAAGLSRTPVVALSASAFEHERAAVLVAGCDAFLAKPFREDDLFGLLGGLLGVTYVYDEPEGTASPSAFEAAAVNRERLGRLPEAWRARFRDALGRADAEEALRLVSEVEGEDPALIRAIAARLRAYRMDELEELLEPPPEGA